jgi:putative PIN family toxin of toxin-antitoxin system
VHRVVIDTNVWVSALLNPAGHPAEVVVALLAGRFRLVTSTPLLDELTEVLQRPRIERKHGLSPDDIFEYVGVLRRRADVVAVTGELQICRDPDDDVVIETALLGNADAFGDARRRSFARARASGGTQVTKNVSILTVQHFLEMLNAGEPATTS